MIARLSSPEKGEIKGAAAILDSLDLSIGLLDEQPSQYRRAILLISETLDAGSHLKLDEALRAIGDTNATIYAVAFSSSNEYRKREGPRPLVTVRFRGCRRRTCATRRPAVV